MYGNLTPAGNRDEIEIQCRFSLNRRQDEENLTLFSGYLVSGSSKDYRSQFAVARSTIIAPSSHHSSTPLIHPSCNQLERDFP